MRARYYKTISGNSPVEEFLNGLLESTRLEIADALALLESGKVLAMPLSRNLYSIRLGLHELRFCDKGGQIRVIYFVKKRVAIYIVHAFRKKTQEIPKKELAIILKRIREI